MTADHKTIAAPNPANEKWNNRKRTNVAKRVQSRAVNFRLAWREPVICLTVRDNGVGMEHQQLDIVQIHMGSRMSVSGLMQSGETEASLPAREWNENQGQRSGRIRQKNMMNGAGE